MHSFKEQQGKIRNPSSVISAKKQRKTIEWETLESSSRKLRDTKGTFHAKRGTIKERNGMDLTEAKDTKKMWQNTQKNYTRKMLMTQIIMMVSGSPRARHPGV